MLGLSQTELLLVLSILAYLGLAFVASVLAMNKCRCQLAWALSTLILPPAILVLLFLKRKDPCTDFFVECPHCMNVIQRTKKKCPHCGADLHIEAEIWS